MQKNVIGLGEILWDVFSDRKNLGGAPANFAYHVSQFNCQGRAVSAIGRDAPGEELKQRLTEKSVSSCLQENKHPTGSVTVSLDGAGIPTYIIHENVAWDFLRFTPELKALASKVEAVCFGTLAQRHSVSRETIRLFLDHMPADSLRIFDINLRQQYYSAQIVQDSLKRCNILKINDEEIVILLNMLGLKAVNNEQAIRCLLELYDLSHVILTCGAVGSYVVSADECSYLPTPKVEVVDTVGAGDSFTGSFCAGILHGLSLTEAHRLAVDVSAYVCSSAGAMPEIPETLKNRLQ